MGDYRGSRQTTVAPSAGEYGEMMGDYRGQLIGRDKYMGGGDNGKPC
jgi:hypothetical protein